MTTEEIKQSLREKWLGPSGFWFVLSCIGFLLSCVVGGVIWGERLERKFAENDEFKGRVIQWQEIVDKHIDDSDSSYLRLSMVLTRLEEELKISNSHVKEHDKESEEWKRLILLNKQKIEQQGKDIDGHNHVRAQSSPVNE